MDTDTVFKLQVITILDSTCYGLIYGFLAPYIVRQGADQVIVGVLTVGNLLCTLLSSHIITNFGKIHGKHYTLYMIFNTAMVSHLMMVFTDCYWFTIFSRYIFCVTNQSQNLCKELLLGNAPEDKRECFSQKFTVLNCAGLIIGPFIAGCLFDFGFGYICLLAAALTFINTYLMLNICIDTEESPPQPEEHASVAEKTQNDICDVIQEFKKADFENNWDILTIKYLYLSSVIIFSSKFTQILKHNYKSSQFNIGYTSSYMNGLNFAGAYYVDSLRNKYMSDMPILKIMEYGLILSGIFLLVACYAPIYVLYAFTCGPIFLMFNLMSSIWKNLFLTRENDSLNELSKYTGVIVGLTVPLLFGLVHKLIGHHAAILFSTVPILVSFYILKKHTYGLFMENGDKVKLD